MRGSVLGCFFFIIAPSQFRSQDCEVNYLHNRLSRRLLPYPDPTPCWLKSLQTIYIYIFPSVSSDTKIKILFYSKLTSTPGEAEGKRDGEVATGKSLPTCVRVTFVTARTRTRTKSSRCSRSHCRE